MSELQPLLAAWLRAPRPLGAEQAQFGWLLEELRVSLFAQHLKTPVPVSAKRLAKLWQSIRR
jgi:ATP-dependent helicase HrpA